MQPVNLPPLKFLPILKSVIWGGEKIAPFKGLTTEQKNIGESWEVSGVPSNPSVVENGPDAGLTLPQMLEKYGEKLVGTKVYERYGNTFPLLVKIIDAAGDLSVQVHPHDELARKRHNSLGKTEMWYIVDTDPGAKICAGLARQLTPEEYAARIADNTIMDALANHDSHPGDVFFLPAGRIHSIGAGNLLVEVQETSDITYRIYDFGRVDAKSGLPRQLHVEESKDAVDFTVYPDYVSKAGEEKDGVSELVHCGHFTVDRVRVDGTKEFTPGTDSFTIFTCTEGSAKVTDDRGNTIDIKRGESVLIPAMATKITVSGNAELIQARA